MELLLRPRQVGHVVQPERVVTCQDTKVTGTPWPPPKARVERGPLLHWLCQLHSVPDATVFKSQPPSLWDSYTFSTVFDFCLLVRQCFQFAAIIICLCTCCTFYFGRYLQRTGSWPMELHWPVRKEATPSVVSTRRLERHSEMMMIPRSKFPQIFQSRKHQQTGKDKKTTISHLLKKNLVHTLGDELRQYTENPGLYDTSSAYCKRHCIAKVPNEMKKENFILNV